MEWQKQKQKIYGKWRCATKPHKKNCWPSEEASLKCDTGILWVSLTLVKQGAFTRFEPIHTSQFSHICTSHPPISLEPSAGHNSHVHEHTYRKIWLNTYKQLQVYNSSSLPGYTASWPLLSNILLHSYCPWTLLQLSNIRSLIGRHNYSIWINRFHMHIQYIWIYDTSTPQHAWMKADVSCPTTFAMEHLTSAVMMLSRGLMRAGWTCVNPYTQMQACTQNCIRKR